MKRNLNNKYVSLIMIYLPGFMISFLVFLFSYGYIELNYLINLTVGLLLTYIAAVFDLKTKKVSNRYVTVMLYVILVLMGTEILIDGSLIKPVLIRAGLGILCAFLLFISVYLLSKGGMGGADVKLMSVLGLYIGYEMVLTTTFIAAILTSLVGGILILLKKMDKKAQVPFIPFIYLGLLITTILYSGGMR